MRGRGQPILAVLALAASSAVAQQGFYREYYAGISGGAVANLTNAPAFPDSPDVEEIVNNVLETGTNIGDYYGQRVRAVITPAVTATNYFFWIASDDGSELWLGTNAFPASRRRIAYVSGWTSPRVWTSSVYQCSAAISLTAGTPYYIEALQKENSGGDNLAVAWLVPGSGVTSVIPASVMRPYLEAPAVKTQPQSVEIEEQWAGTRDVSFSVEAVRKAGVSYQWQRDGADLAGATQPVYTCFADLANSNRLFQCRLASLGGAVTSLTARYTFVPDRVPPAVTACRFSHDRRQMALTFSEPLLPASVSNGAFDVTGAAVAGVTLLTGATDVVVRLASPLAAGSSNTLTLAVEDCAAPANRLASSLAVCPAPWAAAPVALLRGGVEPPGPSSRRSPLALTEISHTPAPRGDGRDLRFVELYNSNPFPQDIGSYRFSGAFDYTLPAGTALPANGYLVIAPAPADIEAVYGVTNVLGGFAAEAFGGTSEITLNDEQGAWLTTVAYSDDPPWPVATDGSGHTLVLARPSYGEREADGWAASARLGGSPGAAEPPRPTAYESVLFNEVLAHGSAAPGYVELHNASSSAVSLAGCVLTRGKASDPGHTLPEGAVLPPYGFLAFDENALGFLIDGTGDTLWLFAPAAAGGEVIDAVRFGDQEEGVALGRYPDGDAFWSRLEAPTPGDVNAPRLASQVVLNELMYHPISGNKDDEYVEVYNAGTNEVDLAGWKLGGDISFTFEQVIPAGGYLIVPRDHSALAQLYPGQAALMTGGYGGSLDNSRGRVTLSRPVTVMDTGDPASPVSVLKNAVVEEVIYRDGGEWGKLADGGGSSLERVDPRADPRLARSWAASDETGKSAWTTVSFTGAIDNGFTASANGDPNAVTIGLMDGGECLVDAVEVQVSGGPNLVSNPSFEDGTNFWRFMGTHDRSAVEADAAAPDGQSVLHLRASDRCHNSMNICRGMLNTTLAKSGSGTISVRARWLSGCPELLARTRGSWIEACGDILTTRALGSPGQRNSRAADNAAPALFDVLHQPVLPRNGEAVMVYARARDPDGVSACTLRYRVEGRAGTNAVAMVPAAGGYFAGEIPAGQPSSTIVAFFVEAADACGQTARDRFPAGEPARECLVRYNEPLDSRAFGIYRFWMTKENIAYWAAREKASNQPVDATFLYGTNRVIYQAGMQYAGSPFHSSYAAPIDPTRSIDYEANFQNDDKLLDDDGVVLSTIGNLGSDTNGIREQFCYSLAHAVKIPHMYRRYIHLYANGAEQNTKKIYEDTEKPNAGVLKHWFPEDAGRDFFKVDDWFEHTLDLSSFSYITGRLQKYTTTNGLGEVELKLGRYRWNWLKRGYETFRANDYTNFFGLVEALNTADPDAYPQRIQETVNLEKFVPVIAVNEFIGNFDSYGFSRGKNMYLYDSADGWQLIAWDLDYNFGMSRPLNDPINPALASFPTEDPTMRTFLKTPLVARIFWRAVESIASSANDPALLAWTRAKYDAMKADGAVLTGTFDGFMNLVETRRTNVVAQLAAANPAALAVASPDGAVSTSTQNVMTVSGTAPFAAATLRINGADVPIVWTSPSNWTAQVVLNGGTNTFTVEAFATDGSPLSGGGVTRTVVYAGPPLDAMEGFLGFSEILSEPAAVGAAYVEIANRSATTHMNLSGFYVAGAVSFTFPAGTVLKPGARLCVAEDAAAFAAAYGAGPAASLAGVYSGRLPRAGTLLLKRPAAGFEPDDPEIDRVVFEASDPWPEGASAGISLRLINPGIDNNRVANWSAEETAIALSTNAVPWNMTWRYFQTGYPGDAWLATTFNDSGWLSGPGPLGYETAVLPVPLATTNSLAARRMAYYYRTSFVFTNDPASSVLQLTYMLDDAAAFYLNGQEICRSSLMPTGEVTDATAATTAKTPEGQIEGPFTLPAAALRKGTNVLAVTVHQNQSNSSDIVFGMTLDIVAALTNTCSPAAADALDVTLPSLPGVWLNEVQPLNVSGPADGAGEREPWVELYNAETGAVSLAGWSLAAASADPGWAFPSNAEVAAGGFLRVWLDGEPGEGAAPAELHAGLRFAVTNGLLVLRAPLDGRTVTVDYLRVTNAAADAVWGAYPDGASNPRRWLNPATPCASNRIDRPAVRVVINEFMAQNDLYTNPLNGKMDDWFELFNDGAGTVDLTGYVITDTLLSEEPPVPDLRSSKSLIVSNGVSLLPGQALRIWTGASKVYLLPFDPANLQAPFGLSKDGDQICLFDPSLRLVDRLVYTNEQSGSASVGRWVNGAEGSLVSFARPTPGAPNRNPRYSAAVLAQPPPFTLPEETPFCHTNAFETARPSGFAFRLYPAEGTELPSNLLFDTDSGVLAWTPSEAQGPGLYALRVCGFTVEGASVTARDEVLLTLSVLEVPSRPVLGALPALTVSEGEVATFTASATRGEEIPPYVTATVLRLADPLPTNAVFDAASGVFRWATGESDGPCTQLLTVVASDASDSSVWVSAVVTVRVDEVNEPPTWRSPAAFYLWRGEPFAIGLRCTDPDLPPNRLTFGLDAGPEGLMLDPDTGLLQWQPAPDQTGAFSVRVRASDNAGCELCTNITISVDAASLQASALVPAAAGGAFDIRWESKPDAAYTVEWRADLRAGEWQAVNADAPVTGTGGMLSLAVSPAALGSPTNAFFRIRQTR